MVIVVASIVNTALENFAKMEPFLKPPTGFVRGGGPNINFLIHFATDGKISEFDKLNFYRSAETLCIWR